jgi:hypothetical protein
MFMLAVVFLTTCQTVFSEMPYPHVYPRGRHSGIADHFRYRLPLATHQASLSPNSGRERFEWPSLANEIDDRPALLPTLQSLQRQFRKPAATQSATEQDGQIARLRFPVRVCPSGTCQSAAASPAVSQLPKREPSLRTP